MQHHGVATRLLDWTESLAVALFFALRKPYTQPCIWIMNPYKLNKISLGEHWILNLELDARLHYDKAFAIGLDPWPYKLPVAIDSVWRDSRLMAQKGFFTLHGTDSRPLNEQKRSLFIKIEIPLSAVHGFERFIEHSGINEYTLFPDLDGLSRWLNMKYLY